MTKSTYLSFRILTSFIFIYAGIKHLLGPEKVFARLSASTLYGWIPQQALFYGLIVASGIIMLAGGICLAFNCRVRPVAIALLLMLIPITLSVQLEHLNDLGPFFKNVAIAGSLITLIKLKQHEIH